MASEIRLCAKKPNDVASNLMQSNVFPTAAESISELLA